MSPPHSAGPPASDGRRSGTDRPTTNYTRYRQAHPNHPQLSRKEFIQQLNLSPAAETWLNLKSVEYRPFAATNSLADSAIVVYPSGGSGSGDRTIVFAIRDLLAH